MSRGFGLAVLPLTMETSLPRLRARYLVALCGIGLACTPQTPSNVVDFGNGAPTTSGSGEGDASSEGASSDGRSDPEPVRLDLPPPGEEGDDSPLAGDETACPEIAARVEREPATIWLLVDQSTSMDEDFGDVERWDAVHATLFDPDEGVVARLDGSAEFGMTLYTSDSGFEGGDCPILTSVSPDLHNHKAMQAAFEDSEGPTGDTPTAESLAAVATELAARERSRGPKVVVLATDGEPDTCARPNPQDGQPESLDAARAAFAAGVTVVMVSVGDEIGDEHLQQMANLGAGLDIDDPEGAPFYRALDPDELLTAFESIVSAAISCEFSVDGDVDPDLACAGSVSLDGTELECDGQWTLRGNDRIELLGEACERLKDGEDHDLAARWPCEAFVPVG